ncbi:histidine kinase dimerization/phospho-acceptor domain-containing protein [Natronorubrum sp. FCH18a]|uniref:sensor histidine kinase n=1 Tax=Natronorubrum sp. FCH18a TaxID=3447018 RepID=UPI003F517895
MTHPPGSRPRTVLYVAKAAATARSGAAALEGVDSGPDRTVQALSADALDKLRSWAPEADCVVFAETPTTAAGASLLEVVDACGETPLVLFCEPAYAPTAARSTDGIAGYVRRDTDDAVAHLVDEIEWVCHGAAIDEAETAEDETAEDETTEEGTTVDAGSAADRCAADEAVDTNADEEPLAVAPVRPTDLAESADAARSSDSARSDDRSTAVSSLESLTELAAWREHESGRERGYELLVEFVADVCETDYCWLSTVHFGEFTPRAGTAAVPDGALEPIPLEGPIGDAFRAGESLRIDDVDDAALEPPFEDAVSLSVAPVGDVGVVQLAATEPNAFDETTDEILEACCRYGAAILERTETTSRLRTERDRARRERTRLEAERDRLESERDRATDERDRLTAERDRLETAFASLPIPALRYELVDGRVVVRDVTEQLTITFDIDRTAVVDSGIDGAGGTETTVPPGLEDRAPTLSDAVRSTERRQFVSRRETGDGIREFLLTVVPCSLEDDGETTESGAESAESGAESAESGAESAGSGAESAESGAESAESGTDDGPAEGAVVYTDVTDANQLERELAAVEHRLETIAQLVDDDVRTPLNVARGYLELVEETGDREHFQEVDDAQERLLELVDQLAAIARGNGTDALVDTEPVALHDVARRAWVVVDTGDARLVTEENLVLEADKSRVQELFEHLFQAVVHGEETTGHDGTGPDGDADERRTADEETGRSTADSTVVSVGTADDGFYVTGRWNGAGETGGVASGADLGRLAACDGAGLGLGPVERIADAHGWDIGIAEDEDRIAFAFRGVDSADVDGT